MRVLEPNKAVRVKKKKFSLLPVLIFAVVCVFGWLAYSVVDKLDESETVVTTELVEKIETAEKVVTDDSKKTLNDFSGDELRLYYDNLLLPGLNLVDIPPTITGNDVVDTIIRQIAEERGYKLRAEASADLISVDGLLVQEPVVDSWNGLKRDVSNAGHSVNLSSGYRSINEQRALFLERLGIVGATIDSIESGDDEDKVIEVLEKVAPPGYSKHHTGYTIDVFCSGFAFYSFDESTCYETISANNYEIAKKNGFIPSYPKEANYQGPSPEAWEYVWVGGGSN